MKQIIILRFLIALTTLWTTHSKSIPRGSRFDNKYDPELDHLERDMAEDFGEPESLDKRRIPLSRYVNWHASLPWDNIASGGSAEDLLGEYSFQSGFSTIAWTAYYEGYDLPFLFNFTSDFGYCNRSIYTSTDIGVYNYLNGTVSNSTKMSDVAADIIPLVNVRNYTDTQNQTDHLIVQAQAAYDEHNQALLKLAGFCAATGQSTLVPGQPATPPPDDTKKIQYIHDELRRKLLMYGGLDPLDAAEQGQAPQRTMTTIITTATATPVVTVAVPLLPGPTRHGYNFYVGIGAPTSLVFGAGVAWLNQLAWHHGKHADVDWSAVTNTAFALLLGFILSAAILGRFLAFGSFNNAGAAAAAVVRNPADTLIRPAVRNAGSGTRMATRRTINTSRETLSFLATTAKLRRGLREQGEVLDRLEQDYQEHRIRGRPSSDPLGVNDLREAGFSLPNLPIWTGQSAGTAGTAGQSTGSQADAHIPGSTADTGVCDVEQGAASLAAGLAYMQSGHTYSYAEAEEDGVAGATGMGPASPDEEVIREEDEGRDGTGHCKKQ